MTPRHAFAICELSALVPRQEETHSAANVVVPKTKLLAKQTTAFACACLALFSGLSKRAKAFALAISTALGSENCLSDKSLVRFRASGSEKCLIIAALSLALTSGRFITWRCRSIYCSLNSGFENLSLAFWLRFCLHSGDQRRSRCFCFVSSDATHPDAPSPPSVRLQRPSAWYLRISSLSSSKAHHSCMPA